MDSAELRAVQKPLKDSYRQNPGEALITLRAHGQLDGRAIACDPNRSAPGEPRHAELGDL
jgi:hypothetical protein